MRKVLTVGGLAVLVGVLSLLLWRNNDSLPVVAAKPIANETPAPAGPAETVSARFPDRAEKTEPAAVTPVSPSDVSRSGPASDAPLTARADGLPVLARGEAIRAEVRIGEDKVIQLAEANQMGHFPRVNVPPGSKLALRVVYPDGEPGQPVGVTIEDSGYLIEDRAVSGVRILDQDQAIGFSLQFRDEPGVNRVTLRKGADLKTLEFWLGDEPATAER